jgi:uncharacterized membrane protein
MGILEHDHIETGALEETHSTEEHLHGSINIFSERWINLLFAGISIFTLYLTLKAKKHFIKEHLWNHVIVNHFKSISCGLSEHYLSFILALNIFT